MLWFVLGFLVGTVVGAKHQVVTLALYSRYKPTLDRWKKSVVETVGKLFKQK
jgi:hypothetical protein